MKYFTVLIWIFTCWSLRLVCCQLKCSSSGEYLIISNKLANIVIPDRSIVQPYEPDIQIPSVCDVDRTCSSLMLEVENNESKLWEKHIWAPNIGRMRYFKLNGNGSGTPPVTYGPTQYASNCFKFFHIENRRMGALCIGRVLDENLVVPYKILYDEQGGIQDNQLGIQIHLNIENHSPFIVLNSTREFEVIGISYFEHLSLYKLFIIHYNAESSDTIDVPSDCPGPHDLQPIEQSDAIVRCANGKVLYLNVWHLSFTVLSHINIEIVSTCTNTASFVLVQGTDNIIFNKSGVIYQLAVNNSGRPLRIASAVCHAFNEEDITYYFADATSGAIYNLYLGDIVTASSRQAIIPQIVRDGVNRDDAMISLYIDGPILWGRLTLSNHTDVTVYITDLLTNKQSLSVSVNGPSAFVQLYTAEKCAHAPQEPTGPPKVEENSNSQFMNDVGHVILIVVLVIAFVIIVLLVIILLTVYVVRHRNRPRPSIDNNSLDMDPIGGEQQDDRSQSLDNSAAALIPEQYEVRPPPAHPLAAFNDDCSADTTPVQIQDQQDPKLATPNMELVAGVIKKAKPPATVSNPGPSALDEVD